MIDNNIFLGILFCVFILVSPLLALVERLILGLGVLLIVFLLGFAIISSPILFLAGIALILASEATVTSGLYYILIGVVSPFILIPLFFFFRNLAEDDLIESSHTVSLANISFIVLAFFIIGTHSVYFTTVVILALILTAGDFAMRKTIDS